MKRSIALLLTVLVAAALTGCRHNLAESIENHIPELVATANLGTVEYTVNKVVKAEDVRWYGDRKLLFSTTAVVKAGIPMADFCIDSVEIDERHRTAIVHLPAAQVISINMVRISKVYEDVDMLRSGFSNEERNRLLAQAERKVRRSAPDLGILAAAEENATDFFTALLTQMGFRQITVLFPQHHNTTKP